MNKWDLHRKDKTAYSLPEAKKDLEKIFSDNQLDDIFSDIDIINCSGKDYKAFLLKKKEILNFEKYFNKLKSNFENIYKDKKHKEDEDKNDAFYNYIINDLNKKIGELIKTSNQDNNQFADKNEIINKLNNFLSQNDYNN